MATMVEKGMNYTAQRVRSGSSPKGQWELISVVDNRGKNPITVYVRNMPCGVVEGQKFNVEELFSVKYGFKKDKFEKWQPSISCEATVHPIASEYDTEILGQGDVNWTELQAGDDPWADIAELPM